MTPLRVLIVCRNSVAHERSGGMEKVAASMATTLRERGHRVGLVTTRGADMDELQRSHDRVWVVPGSRRGRYSMVWWLAMAMRLEALRWEPHVVVSVGDGGGPLAWRRRRRFGVAMQVHGTPTSEVRSALRSRSARDLYRVLINSLRIPSRVAFMRSVDEVWVIGDDVRAELGRRPYRVPAGRIRETYNGVDAEKFAFSAELRDPLRRRLGVDPRTSVGLAVGRLEHQKGVDIAVAALAQSPDSRHLLVAGDGPERARLVSHARNAGVEDRVTFLGWLDQAGVRAAMSAADVLLFPTRRVEGLPLVSLEAVAAGLPVVTTHTARVPVELAGSTRVVAPDARAIGEAWATAATTRDAVLPAKFTRSASQEALCRAVEALATRATVGGNA